MFDDAIDVTDIDPSETQLPLSQLAAEKAVGPEEVTAEERNEMENCLAEREGNVRSSTFTQNGTPIDCVDIHEQGGTSPRTGRRAARYGTH